jgi:hypothetical protein
MQVRFWATRQNSGLPAKAIMASVAGMIRRACDIITWRPSIALFLLAIFRHEPQSRASQEQPTDTYEKLSEQNQRLHEILLMSVSMFNGI